MPFEFFVVILAAAFIGFLIDVYIDWKENRQDFGHDEHEDIDDMRG